MKSPAAVLTASLARLRDDYAWYLALFIGCVAGLILILPTAIVILNSFNAASFLTFPPTEFSFRWYEAVFQDGQLISAARTSLLAALAVAAIDVAIGVPAALALTRGRFRGRELFMAVFLSPLTIPHIVLGLALLAYFSSIGVTLGMPTLILGHIVITTPFVIRIVAAGAARLDPTLEEAAANLGASAWQAFRRITLPALTPAIAAGAAFAFIGSFDNLEISLFIATGRVETLPVRLYSLVSFEIDPIVGAISTIQIGFSILLIFLLDRLIGLGRAGGVAR